MIGNFRVPYGTIVVRYSVKGRPTMPFIRILRLGLIHVAVAITLVPINGTLNRIMISEHS
jgi:hypothetical protein